ncbi:MAG: FUSC family protein, partial [Roseiarcus sp.]
ASLRKGWFRMVGTIVGAVAIVVLTACFPQEREGFLLGLVALGRRLTGAEIIRLRRVARRFDWQVELAPALDAMARGDSSTAIEHWADSTGCWLDCPAPCRERA